jgi:hypothetical protein
MDNAQYKGLTLAKIREAIADFFVSREELDENVTYDQLRDRLLPGYAYRINESAMTGIGGAKLFLNQMASDGVPAYLAQEAVEVFTHETWVSLKDVTTKPIE